MKKIFFRKLNIVKLSRGFFIKNAKYGKNAGVEL
jgi:hypothetical protein